MLCSEMKPIELKVRLVSKFNDEFEPRFYETIPCASRWVGDDLETEIPRWTPRNPVFIDAPVGRGKSSFVYQKVLPYALSLKRNVLLISNRVALSAQQKKDVMKAIDSPLQDCLTDYGVRKTEKFGPVWVTTIHRIPALLSDPENKTWLNKLGFVVMDEAHFFTSDAQFNNGCDGLLELITTKFQHAVRIFMTGTSWDILEPLAEAELNNYRDISRVIMNSPLENRVCYRYFFEPDYSHINLNFFDNLEAMKEIIMNSQDKFLIFSDSKQRGREFVNSLPDRAMYLDADSKETPEWNSLLSNHMFDKQVLVTTAALDCGIDIIDPALKHLVILSDDRVTLLQMLGRKRLAPNEKIELYVKNVTRKHINDRYWRTRGHCRLYDRYLNADKHELSQLMNEIWNADDPMLRQLFRPGKEMLYPNKLAFFKLRKRLEFYRHLKDDGIEFEDVIRNWLDKAKTETDDDDCMAQLVDFCEQFEGIELNDVQVDSLRQRIVRALKQRGHSEPQPKRVDTLKQAALNNRLQRLELPYMIRSDAWIIEGENNDRSDTCS